jgi:hypothetical protein
VLGNPVKEENTMSQFVDLDELDFEEKVKFAPSGTGPYCACVLVLDNSGSMDKDPIEALTLQRHLVCSRMCLDSRV